MKDEILRLRSEGKNYNEIKAILGCSKGTIAYHCGKGQKEKTKERTKKRRKNTVISQRVECFRKIPKSKCYGFHRDRKCDKTYEKPNFTWQDVIAKYGWETNCYLTGKPISLKETKTYQFDHITPKSKGGTNKLDNLGIACRDANQAKNDLMLSEFLELCQDVLKNFGYKIQPPETNNNS
jgi:5-methylcytosine-specific restriction endonuclease McrA